MEHIRLRTSLHELSNVLAIVYSSAELLQCDLGRDHPCSADVANIIDACKRGIVVVQTVREAAIEKSLSIE